MSQRPHSHIEDALKLEADGIIDLYELTPLSGGTIYFKSDAEAIWRGVLYESLPCSMAGEEFKTEGTPTPKFTIGQEDVDLLAFKGLVNDGHLDGALLVRKRVLLDDLVNNRDIKHSTYFRVKRVESYTRSAIQLQMATFSTAHSQTVPFRQYVPPAFPWVEL